MRPFHEFLAGSGMARLGLGSGWKGSFAGRRERAEVQSGGMSGCLSTGSDESGRAIVMAGTPSSVRSRLLWAGEAARSMGLPDTCRLPKNYRDACRPAGDGIVVPAVRHLEGSRPEAVVDAPGHATERAA